MNIYEDLIDRSRPVYERYPPMPVEERAAQFSPFAAVVGYGEAVAEEARYTEKRAELNEDEIYEIDLRLKELSGIIKDHPLVRVSYFVPDRRKTGGAYENKTCKVKKIDEYSNEIVFEDDTKIPVSMLSSLDIIKTQ